MFMLIRIIMATIWIFCAFKWGDWKNWKKYYSSMLFFGMGDLIYISVFHSKPLWRLEADFLVPSLNELFVIFTIFFPSTLLFISRLPKGLFHKIAYIMFWIAIYMGIELFTTSIGMQKNYNNWTLKWSLLHNTIQFPVVAIHHKNPLLAWLIALAFLAFIMETFNVPFIINLASKV